MRFPEPLLPGRLVRRFQRFLAEVDLAGDRRILAHCPNSGSMLGLAVPGSPVLVSPAPLRRGRKLAYTLEMVAVEGFWVGVHTGRTNALAQEALEAGVIRELGRPLAIRPEVRLGPDCRLDFLLTLPSGPLFLEVKNCTLVRNGIARFPDAVTVRGTKHLRHLTALAAAGQGAAVLFVVQRGDALLFQAEAGIDPVYAAALDQAAAAGVQVLAYRATLAPGAITVDTPLPWRP
ncbi:MAG: DNA/RNA nuclease SfsA [Thermodesulfobacteriota bacterium]